MLVCENLLVLPWKQKLKTNQMIRVDIKLSLSSITPNFNRWFIRSHIIICISKFIRLNIYVYTNYVLLLCFYILGFLIRFHSLKIKLECHWFSSSPSFWRWDSRHGEKDLLENHQCRTGVRNQDIPSSIFSVHPSSFPITISATGLSLTPVMKTQKNTITDSLYTHQSSLMFSSFLTSLVIL